MTTSILQLVALDETGDSSYRMRWPGRDLSLQTAWSVLNLDARAEERFVLAEQADLLILFQSEDLELIPIIEKRRASGKCTLAEYNDNFYATSAWFPVHHAWSSPLVWQRYEIIASLVDAVIVTGEPLAEELRKRIPRQEFLTIKNYLPMVPQSIKESIHKKGKNLLVGWGGSFGHLADLLHFYPVIQSAIKIAGNGSFACMGNRALPDLCKSVTEEESPQHPDRFVEWGSMDKYFAFLSTLHIGVIPLCPTPYNNCRSDIKAVEMGACGVAPLVPELPPYREFISATNCPTYSSEESFKSALIKLLLDDSYRVSVAERAHTYVTEARVGIRSREREELYSKFLPVQSSRSSQWPYEEGYFEKEGTHQSISKTKIVLDRIDGLLRNDDVDGSQQIIDQVKIELGYQPEVLVRHVQVLLRKDRSNAYCTALDAFNKFPRDLRFLVGMIRAAPSSEQQSEHLRTLSKILQDCSNSREFFQGVVTRLLLSLESLSSPLCEEFGALYPTAVQLQVHLAERARIVGDRESALRRFRRAEEAIRVLEMNDAVPSGVDVPYIRMWIAALSQSFSDAHR